MSKRLPNLHAWQWRGYHHNHRNPTNLALDLGQLAVGIIALIAGLGLQRQGHRLEAEQPEPFSDHKDAIGRLLVEQFVTFPRFVLSGAWWRAWRNRHRH